MAFIINASGEEEEIDPSNGSDFELKELQQAIGGYIQVVRLRTGKLLVVDEDGLLKNLPINTKASLLAGQSIVGTAVLCEEGQIL